MFSIATTHYISYSLWPLILAAWKNEITSSLIFLLEPSCSIVSKAISDMEGEIGSLHRSRILSKHTMLEATTQWK